MKHTGDAGDIGEPTNPLVTDMSKPLAVVLTECSAVRDLRERLLLITPELITACERRFRPMPADAITIGEVKEPGTRALLGLWYGLNADAMLESAKANAAILEEMEKDHNERHSIFDMLSDVARELFYTQAKLDLGFHKCAGVGIYTGWQLAERTGSSGPPAGLMAMIRTTLPLGGDD